jgi:cell growth-regulating nucleolar protein
MAALVHQVHQPQPAYVEDVPESLAAFLEREHINNDSDADDDGSDDEVMPHAPTPPPATDEVNVFDFLVANATPNASNMDLSGDGATKLSTSTQLVRYDRKSQVYVDQKGVVVDDKAQLVQYGTGPIPAALQTPAAAKLERRKTKDGDREIKKDKKRKRLHVDTDHIMSDAPPVLHSGLTGGLKSLMSRPSVFPPSPEYSADAAETPASPLKKSKHSKGKRSEPSIGNNLISMLTAQPKGKKRKSVSSVGKKKRSSSSGSRRRSSDGSDGERKKEKSPKLIEYRSPAKDSNEKDSESGAVVVFKPRPDLFLSFVKKGPESERGCSVNKALKRFHRERSATGNSLGKSSEEKELWRSLRMRRNDRGEIVLFCI